MNSKLLVIAALAGVGTLGVLGGTTLNALQARAQEATTTQVQTAQTGAPSVPKDETQATHVGSNGQREELLTGDTAEKVKAAALKAVPGGTIQRVETEVDGNGVYEAHMTKSDGSRVTVFFDANFNLTSTEEGRGGMKTN